MKFIQAAPDELYFTWQYKVQAANFREFDLEKNMTILVGLQGRPPSDHIKEFEKTFKGKIHYYNDTRKSKAYLSSIRPNLIKQYLAEYPTDVFCYIDQDIIWLEHPNLDRFADTPHIYTAAGAKGYTWANYMKAFKNGEIYEGLCKIFSVDPVEIEKQDENAGAAQFIIKGTDSKWWGEYEDQLEEAYKFIDREIAEDRKNGKYHFQIWSVDCNALWLKLNTLGRPLANLKEIDFAWPNQTFEDAKSKGLIMMHNSGIAEGNRNHKETRKVEKKGQLVDEEFDTGRPRYLDKGLYRANTPFDDDFSYIDPSILQSHYVSYFKQFSKNQTMQQPKRKILALWNSTYGRTSRKIPLELVQASLKSLKEAADATTEVDIEVVTTTWEHIEGNPFKEYITHIKNLGHLNYIIQLKHQLANHTGSDIVCIVEHDVLIAKNYFNEVMKNWDFSKYGLNNRNYIGLNKTGYLDVVERHHPYSMMSMATFWMHEHLNRALEECIKNIDPAKGYPNGWAYMEPHDKGQMAEYWGSVPNIHVSTAGLPNDLHHNFTSHDTVCYEHDSKGKVKRDDWGHYLDLLPFFKQYV